MINFHSKLTIIFPLEILVYAYRLPLTFFNFVFDKVHEQSHADLHIPL